MDPVPSLTGRSVIPDPSWTLAQDPYFDLKKIDDLKKEIDQPAQ